MHCAVIHQIAIWSSAVESFDFIAEKFGIGRLNGTKTREPFTVCIGWRAVAIPVDCSTAGKIDSPATGSNCFLHSAYITRFLGYIYRETVIILHLYPVGQIYRIRQISGFSASDTDRTIQQTVVAGRRREKTILAVLTMIAVVVGADRIPLAAVNAIDIVHPDPSGENTIVNMGSRSCTGTAASVKCGVYNYRTISYSWTITVSVIIYVTVNHAVPKSSADRRLPP